MFANVICIWLTIKRYKDRSVTEVEILHAVLNNPNPANISTAFFYFKGFYPSIENEVIIISFRQ